MEYNNGTTYILNHSRKGRFAMHVERQDEEWLHGFVAGGTAMAIMDYNIKEKGEEITVRKCHIRNCEAA